MNDAELIAKGRELLNSILRDHPHPFLRAEMFTEARIGQAAMVMFGCKDQEDTVEIIFDPNSGDCLSFTHVPKQPKRKDG